VGEVVGGQRTYVFHPVHQHTRVLHVYPIVKSFLLILTLAYKVPDIHPRVGVEGRAVVLEAGSVGEPLVEGVVVGVEVSAVLVDAVEVGLVVGEMQQSVDVVCFCSEEVSGVARDVPEEFEIVA
jgi:hypothetical protein